MFLEYGRKIPVAEQYFRNFKGYNNFSKVSPYFKKMAINGRLRNVAKVNLHGFLQPPSSPGEPFSQVNYLSPPKQNKNQN